MAKAKKIRNARSLFIYDYRADTRKRGKSVGRTLAVCFTILFYSVAEKISFNKQSFLRNKPKICSQAGIIKIWGQTAFYNSFPSSFYLFLTRIAQKKLSWTKNSVLFSLLQIILSLVIFMEKAVHFSVPFPSSLHTFVSPHMLIRMNTAMDVEALINDSRRILSNKY